MRGEADTVFFHLPQIGQTEHLKAAGVRKDGALPIAELVKSACLPHDFQTGTEKEVIGVAQNDLCAQFLQFGENTLSLDEWASILADSFA
jgi:hypothetical protein